MPPILVPFSFSSKEVVERRGLSTSTAPKGAKQEERRTAPRKHSSECRKVNHTRSRGPECRREYASSEKSNVVWLLSWLCPPFFLRNGFRTDSILIVYAMKHIRNKVYTRGHTASWVSCGELLPGPQVSPAMWAFRPGARPGYRRVAKARAEHGEEQHGTADRLKNRRGRRNSDSRTRPREFSV